MLQHFLDFDAAVFAGNVCAQVFALAQHLCGNERKPFLNHHDFKDIALFQAATAVVDNGERIVAVKTQRQFLLRSVTQRHDCTLRQLRRVDFFRRILQEARTFPGLFLEKVLVAFVIEAERKAKEEAERKAKEEAKRKARKEAESRLAESCERAKELVKDWAGAMSGFKDKKTGKNAFPFSCDNAHSFAEGLAAVRIKNKWGYINAFGEVVIPLEYIEVKDFCEGLAAVRKDDGKWGYINAFGEVVVPFEYDDAARFLDGLARVEKAERIEFKNDDHDIVEPPKVNGVISLSKAHEEGLEIFWYNCKRGFINQKGEIVVPIKYEDANCFSEGLAAVRKGGKVGFIDKTGKIKFYVECDIQEYYMFDEYNHDYDLRLYCFHEGLASVEKDDKWGFVNSEGKLVIPHKYVYVKEFSEGLAAVKFHHTFGDDKWGYIDKTGKKVIDDDYYSAKSFKNGRAEVNKKNKNCMNTYFYIDKNGKKVK